MRIRWQSTKWMVAFLLVAGLGSLSGQPAPGENDLPVTELGSRYASVQNGWVAYARFEALEGVDLNGDGDLEDQVAHAQELSTGEVTNLGLETGFVSILGDWLHFEVEEYFQGEDLNRDGDTDDWVVHVHHFPTRETRNLELAGGVARPWSGAAQERVIVLVSESLQGEDLNLDGDTDDWVVHVHELATGATTNLGLDGFVNAAADRLLYHVAERVEGEDLDGDGDTDDEVLHLRDLSTGETTNLGLTASRAELIEDWIVLLVPESAHRDDLNGDGETVDDVIHVHDLATGETRNLALAMGTNHWLGVHRDLVSFSVFERSQGEDLNGDGDIDDWILHVHDLASGETTNTTLEVPFAKTHGDWLAFNGTEGFVALDVSTGETRRLAALAATDIEFTWGFVDDRLVFTDSRNGVVVHDLPTGTTTELGLDGFFASGWGDWLILAMQPDPEQSGLSAYLVDTRPLLGGGAQLPGDCNQDGQTDISDSLCILGYLFLGEPARLPCGDGTGGHAANLRLLDWGTDGALDLSDAIRWLQRLFLGGPPHPLGPDCVPVVGCDNVCVSP